MAMVSRSSGSHTDSDDTEWEKIVRDVPPGLELLLENEYLTTAEEGYQVVLVNTNSRGRLYVTNFRLIFLGDESTSSIRLGTIPLTTIESVKKKDVNWLQAVKLPSALRPVDKNPSLQVTGKDMRIIVFSFQPQTKQGCQNGLEQVYEALFSCSRPAILANLYAFAQGPSRSTNTNPKVRLLKEYFRLLGLNADRVSSRTIEEGSYTSSNGWFRISRVNSDYKMCKTYPFALVIPESTRDDDIKLACTFRAKSRFPAVSWCQPKNGAVLARSAQPLVGIKNMRSDLDEKLVGDLWKHAGITGITDSTRKLYIVDARPKINSLGNRAVSAGGTESSTYYPGSEIVYLGIDNIHNMRDSLVNLRNYVDYHGAISSDGKSSFMRDNKRTSVASLRESGWLAHVHRVLDGSAWIAARVACESASVLVHCSDGWDRTSQLVSLASLMLDPYYRTIKGFQALVEKDWLAFGHPFADRLGLPTHRLGLPTESSTTSTSWHRDCSPIFLQWVDCISQLLRIYPFAFEFSSVFLVDLLDCMLSSRFGDFLCNSENERQEANVYDLSMCVWAYLAEIRDSVGKLHVHYNQSYNPFCGPILPPAAVLAPTVWPEFHLRWTCPESQTGEIEAKCREMLLEISLSKKIYILKNLSSPWPVVNPVTCASISDFGSPEILLPTLFSMYRWCSRKGELAVYRAMNLPLKWTKCKVIMPKPLLHCGDIPSNIKVTGEGGKTLGTGIIFLSLTIVVLCGPYLVWRIRPTNVSPSTNTASPLPPPPPVTF